MKVDSKLVLIKHQGLARSTRKKTPKPKPNPVETKPTQSTPKPNPEPTATTITPTTPAHTPKKLPSKNFSQLAKMFQQHTPPARLLRKPKPKPEPTETRNHHEPNQPKQDNVTKILTRENLSCQTKSNCQGVSVKNSEKSEKLPKIPTPTTPKCKSSSKSTQKSSHRRKFGTTPLPQEPPLLDQTLHPTLPGLESSQCVFENFGGKRPQPIGCDIEIFEGQQTS